MILLIILVIGLSVTSVFAQPDADSIEVYLIDAYVQPEPPQKFILSFFTSDIAKSVVIIDGRYSYPVSNEFADMHKTEIDMADMKFSGKIVPFVIITENENGKTFTSESFDFDLPFEPEIIGGSNIVQLCLFGGSIFLLPYPNYVIQNGQNYFSLTKEIPIISFRSSNLNYPAGFLSLEYSYIFDAETNNYLRAGYKKIFELQYLKYLSPGVTLYTNFLGNNGVGLELSAGLFTIVDTFTLYARYRYNLKPGDSSGNFHEMSLGLYSGFFSYYLK
ncbi:MAG: hypothetical protein IH950_10630 [Bacteroidetes bacterium]|nr:hypothetical protein [Bacteroidota bacterium]